MNVTLGELFHITSGGTPLKSCKEYYGGNIPWVKTGDLKEMYLQSVDGSITELGLQKSAARMYKPGTVLLAMYGATIGAASILRISATTNQACAAFIKNEKILPEYLYYFLSSRRSNFIHDGVGGAQPNISIGYLKQVPIDLPNISRQKEITDILGRVSILIKNNKCILAKLDALAKARFIEMFGDPLSNPLRLPMTTIGNVCDFEGGSQPPRKEFIFQPQEGYIRLIQIRDYKTDEYITYAPKEKCKRFCTTNDIMIGRYGPPIFQILQGIEGAYNVALMKAIPHGIDKEFMRAYFKREELLHHLEHFQQRTAGQAGIEMSELRAYPCPLPPIKQQKAYVNFVQQVDKAKSVLQKLLEKQELLRAALMQEYFG